MFAEKTFDWAWVERIPAAIAAADKSSVLVLMIFLFLLPCVVPLSQRLGGVSIIFTRIFERFSSVLSTLEMVLLSRGKYHFTPVPLLPVFLKNSPKTSRGNDWQQAA